MMFKNYLKYLFVLTTAVLSVASYHPADAAASSQWEARYYNNKTLSGDPLYIVTESAINHDWSHGTPFYDINKDSFSVKWRRTANFPNAGTYRFTATMDDGMRVWVDDRLIIDSWTDSQVHSLSSDLYLNAGDHDVKVDYYEAGGVAVAKLDWIFISGSAGPTTISNWRGEYFNNKGLSGLPVLIRDDSQINFDWGIGSPVSNVVTSDSFSVRWTRTVSLNAGKYRFTVTADDGIRLWVNGLLVVSQWRDGPATTYNVEVNLSGGNIPLQVEYYENTGAAVAKLSWEQLSGTVTPIPLPPTGNWYAEFFNNKHLSGLPLATRYDATIDFNWGYGSPVPNMVNVDTFSVRWTQTANFTAGTYRFTATSDDGIRLYVNNQLIINAWNDHAVQTYTADLTLSGGSMPIKVEYYENSLLAEARVSWSLLGGGTPSVPTTGLSAIVNTGALNVRSGPGVAYGVIAGVYSGQTVTLTGYRASVGTSTWVSIRTAAGINGWVNARYLSTSYPLNNLMVWHG